jgi:hypothetical protein
MIDQNSEPQDNFIKMLEGETFYGEFKDIRVAFSFDGTPSTEGEEQHKHTLENIEEDVMCKGAYVPFKQADNRAPSAGSKFFQNVVVVKTEILATKDWMSLGGQGYSAENKGKLAIAAYGLFTGGEFKEMGRWECEDACPTKYDPVTGNIFFLCTGAILWVAKCNTNTSDDTKQDWALDWNNATLGSGGDGG